MSIVAEDDRIAAVLDHAANRFFTGALADNEAIERAEELGLVGRVWEGTAGFMGLSKLVLTPLGEARLSEAA